MCAPDVRQPPLEPVSPELLHAAVAAARHSSARPAGITRIVCIVSGNGKGSPPPEGPRRLVLMTGRRSSISRAQARSIAIAAQGFTSRPVANVSAAHLRRLIAQLGVIQIDSVAVLVRSH